MIEFVVDLEKVTFDFALCVTTGQVFLWNQSGEVWHGRDGSISYEVRTRKNELEIRTNGSQSSFEKYFSLNDDSDAEILNIEPMLETVMQAKRGLRLIQPADPVEPVFSFICSANNNLKRITGMVQFLAQDDPFSLGKIAQLTASQLREAKFGYRAPHIVTTAHRIIENGGENWLMWLRTVGYEQAFQAVLELPGVGPKVADCICLYALHFSEAVPVDTHFLRQFHRYFQTNEKRYRAVGDAMRNKFGRHAARAQQWMFVESLFQSRQR